MPENEKELLKAQAVSSSKTTVFLSKKQICKEGQKIFGKIAKEVSVHLHL